MNRHRDICCFCLWVFHSSWRTLRVIFVRCYLCYQKIWWITQPCDQRPKVPAGYRYDGWLGLGLAICSSLARWPIPISLLVAHDVLRSTLYTDSFNEFIVIRFAVHIQFHHYVTVTNDAVVGDPTRTSGLWSVFLIIQYLWHDEIMWSKHIPVSIFDRYSLNSVTPWPSCDGAVGTRVTLQDHPIP